MSCCCHFPTIKSPHLTELTERTYATLEIFISQWQAVDKEPERSICQSWQVTATNFNEFSYHKSCYSRLTSKSVLESAKTASNNVSTSIFNINNINEAKLDCQNKYYVEVCVSHLLLIPY